MRAEDKERLARRQRMLARERGESLSEPEPERTEPKKPERKAKPAAQATKTIRKPDESREGEKTEETKTISFTPRPEGVRAPRTGNTRPFSPILRRRARRRRIMLVVLLLALLLAAASVTGVLGASLSSLGDTLDSVALYFQRGGGWPGWSARARCSPRSGSTTASRSASATPTPGTRRGRWRTRSGSCAAT